MNLQKTYLYNGDTDSLKPFQQGKEPLVERDHFYHCGGPQFGTVFD
jgi:hypothetical protein